MANTFFPRQVGFIPSGSNQDSSVIIGRNPTPAVTWEAIGFGSDGRPDTLQDFKIYLTARTAPQLAAQAGPLSATITINAGSMYDVLKLNPYAPKTGFYFSMREVSVCELIGSVSTERKMMVLASQTYPTGTS